MVSLLCDRNGLVLVVLPIGKFVQTYQRQASGGVKVVDNGPHQVFERIGCREVKSDLGGLLPNARPDLENAELDRIEVGLPPACVSHAQVLERV